MSVSFQAEEAQYLSRELLGQFNVRNMCGVQLHIVRSGNGARKISPVRGWRGCIFGSGNNQRRRADLFHGLAEVRLAKSSATCQVSVKRSGLQHLQSALRGGRSAREKF